MPALSVCLLLDDRADAAVRRLWRALEDDGVPTLASYTHGRHVPHLTLVSLGSHPTAGVRAALPFSPLAGAGQVGSVLPALGAFTRSRCSLVASPTSELLDLQTRTWSALEAAGLQPHQHYRPGAWVPHVTLTARLPVESLPLVARRVYDVAPLPVTFVRAALVDTGSGQVHHLG